MYKPNEAMLLGKCPDCQDGTLHHGPWSHDQIAEAAADIGMPPEDFADVCDDCFVEMVGDGDVKYATELAGRPLVLSRHEDLGDVRCFQSSRGY